MKPFSTLIAPSLHRATPRSTPARSVDGLRGFPHIFQLALLLQPFQVDVCRGARHAAQLLEVAANQHLVVGKVFFQLHVYLHFRKLQGVAGVFAADGTDSCHGLFQPDVGAEADALQPEFQVLVRGAAGHSLCGFQGGGEVAQPFDVHLVAVAQLFAADLRQAVYRVHHIAHGERAAGMHAVVKLPHGYFPVEQRAGMETSLFRVFLIGARILVPVI